MTPIEIPFATTPFRLLMGFACLFIAVVVFGSFTPKFLTYLRSLRTMKTSVAVAGVLIYAVMFGLRSSPL